MGPRTMTLTKRLATSAMLMVALVGTSACASGGGGGGSSSGNPDFITREDIVANTAFANAMEIIRQIRPRWLRAARGQGTATFGSGGSAVEPVVFLDGVRFGGLGSLRDISLTNVVHMDYLDSREAPTLYGTGYMGGAIQVVTRTAVN